jgi:hypothetical protein
VAREDEGNGCSDQLAVPNHQSTLVPVNQHVTHRRVGHRLKGPVTQRQRVVFAPCPLRAQTAGNSRLVAGRGGVRCPPRASSTGPPQSFRRIKLVPKLTVRVPAPLSATHEKTLLHKEFETNRPLKHGVLRTGKEARGSSSGAMPRQRARAVQDEPIIETKTKGRRAGLGCDNGLERTSEGGP